MGIRVTIRGDLLDSEAVLQRLIDLFRRAVRRALPLIARDWENEVKRLCPVDSGDLKRSIRVSVVGGTRLRLQALFYIWPVNARHNRFLEQALRNIENKIAARIRIAFSQVAA